MSQSDTALAKLQTTAGRQRENNLAYRQATAELEAARMLAGEALRNDIQDLESVRARVAGALRKAQAKIEAAELVAAHLIQQQRCDIVNHRDALSCEDEREAARLIGEADKRQARTDKLCAELGASVNTQNRPSMIA